jgi:iron complex outermembrane recepter protein
MKSQFKTPTDLRHPTQRSLQAAAKIACTKILYQLSMLVALALSMNIFSWAQAPPEDLSKLSVEDLMNVEVTSASKKEQKLSRVAAAIFVITQEDIRRSGALNIPDLLRMVPGLDVAQMNGSTWAISSRGFNGQYSNKLLVLVDGRPVYTPTFAGVYWDAQDLPLESIERIEVIRGPGGTIWGANAVNGVISIFTKKAAETQGMLLEAGAGNVAQGFGTVQYGGKFGDGTQYRFYAKYFNDSPLLDLNGQSGGDGWQQLSGGFRVDSALSPKDKLTVEGTFYDGLEGQYSAFLQGVTPQLNPAIHEEVDVDGGAIQAEWKHTYSDRTDSTLQVSFDHYRNGISEPETDDSLNLDYQQHVALGNRHDIVAGLGYYHTSDTVQGNFAVTFVPASRTLQVFNAFVQDEIMLIPDRLYFTVGSKFEHDDYAGSEVMPSARVAWEPSNLNMFWAAVSRALRTPSRADTEGIANVESFPGSGGIPILLRYMGNPNFQNEALLAYEAGYRTTLNDTLSIDLALYFNDYDHLETAEDGALFSETTPAPVHLVEPLVAQNLMYGETHGLELAANWKVTHRWTLSTGYALEQIHMHVNPGSTDLTAAEALEHGAPLNSTQLRSHFDIARNLDWNTSVYFVDRLVNQGAFATSVVPGYTRLDANLNWKIREGFSVSAVGQNLLQDHHVEFLGALGSLQSSELKRSAYVKFVWTLR